MPVSKWRERSCCFPCQYYLFTKDKPLTQTRKSLLGQVCKMSYGKINFMGEKLQICRLAFLSVFFILFFFLFCFYLYACLIQRQLSDIFLTVKLPLSFFKCVCFQEPDLPPFQQQVLSLALGCCRLSIHCNKLIEFISLGITVFIVISVCLTS